MELLPTILLILAIATVGGLVILVSRRADETADGLSDLRQSARLAKEKIWRAIEELRRRDD